MKRSLWIVPLAAALTLAHPRAPLAGETWWSASNSPADALAAVFGPAAAAEWTLSGGAPTAEGGALAVEAGPAPGQRALVCGKRALTLDGQTLYGSVDITLRVKLGLTPDRRAGSFSLAGWRNPTNAQSKGVTVQVSGTFDGDLAVSALDQRAAYDLRAYDTISPVWEDAIRIPLEKDMASLPLAQDKWVQVRCRAAAGALRVWIDDRLLFNRPVPETATPGVLRLVLSPGTRLANVAIRAAAPESDGFEPLPLDGYASDRRFTDGSALAAGALPAGRTVTIEGIPFAFVDPAAAGGADHLDLGRSLLREGRMDGYFPANGPRFSDAFTLDPARIKLQIPNGRYDALYVVAACDSDPGDWPRFSASFFRPDAGFVKGFEAPVPSLRDPSAAGATALPVKLDNGRVANLWLVRVPLDPAALASFSDMDTVSLELTKQLRLYRSYPDPFIYGWHGAGRPSGVRLFAATLHLAPVDMAVESAVFGHVWTEPDAPVYAVTVTNRSAAARTIRVKAAVVSHDGSEKSEEEKVAALPARGTQRLTFLFAVRRNGIHTVRFTLKDGEGERTEERQFCRLARDTRAPFWQEGQGPLFGYWSYHGGHYTPPGTNIMQVMHLAGARGGPHCPREGTPERALFDAWKWLGGPNAWPVTPQSAWAGREPLDEAAYAAYRTSAVARIESMQGKAPDLVAFFPEPHISRDLTAGHPPDYWGETYATNDEERLALRIHMTTARAAAEGVRAAWPNTKILIPWGDPLYIVPFLRAGFPKHLIDGSGLDMIGFERLPEQQLHQMSTHRLYILREEYKRFGLPNPLLYYIEGVFVPTEPGACTWEEQAERYHRWSLISLAYGIERFYSGWFAYDCGNYYGAEHYGGCGIQRRIPYSDPKPAYAHYATMTRMLDRATFDSWLPTGSLSAYCLKFRRPEGGPVYALWTVRGRRPVTLALASDAALTVTDSMDNGSPVAPTNGRATIAIGTAPVYITGAGDIASVAAGEPDHSDSVDWARGRNRETWHTGPVSPPPAAVHAVPLARFGDGSWTIAPDGDETYESNNYDTRRFHGRMSASQTGDAGRPGTFLAVTLEPQATERKLMPWYTVLKPRAPLAIPGKAAALGLWVKAHSDWGRVVYCLADAKGERWLSVGTKDQWNCNDIHGWSMFNFDGWRYLRFELPASSEYDGFREYGATWWGSFGGDGLVDLPLKLEKVIVERRTHVLYVNDVQPADPADVLLDELVAEYESPADATAQAVADNRVRMPLPKGEFALANPIVDLAGKGGPAPVRLERVTMPDWGYDGTRAHVHFTAATNATEYQVWCGAYPDGRGAVVLKKMKASGGLVNGFRPARKLHLWVTYSAPGPDGKGTVQSRPSNRLEIELVDAFSQK